MKYGKYCKCTGGGGAKAGSTPYVSRTTFLENGYLSGKDI